MQYLNDIHWSNFQKDGVLFEKLCHKLINELITDDVHQTRQTRDHAHDLEGKIPLINDDYMIIWGECKYHSQKLSLQKISSTLVMAYLNDIEILYFFSYSEVTDEFRQHITDFCEKAKIHHKIYDDLKLEQLILDYKETDWFSTFFPSFHLPKFELESGGLKIISRLKKLNTEDNWNDVNKDFYVNETFLYCIYFSNCDIHNKKDVVIRLKKDDSLRFVDICAIKSSKKYIKKISVQPGSDTVVVYKLRITNFNPILKLPDIEIEYDKEKILLEKIISVNWLAEVPLLGSKYSKKLIDIQKNHISQNKGNIIYIHGKSGTGKSRLINEILNIYEMNNYESIHFDVEHQNLDDLKIIKQIVSKLERLPLFLPDSDVLDSIVTLKEYHLKMAYHILYDKKYDFFKNFSEIQNYLTYLLNTHKAVIAVDNLQKCSGDVRNLISQIICEIMGHDSLSVILCCTNTDKLYLSEKIEKLHNTFLTWAAKLPLYCMQIESCEYDYAMARLYLRKTIAPQICEDEYLYEKTFSKIISTIGTNPFILQQTVILLEQQSILCLSEKGTFYFKDLENFENTLKSLSSDVKSVLQLREQEFLSVLSPNQILQYKNVIALLLFFRAIPYELIFEIIPDIKILELMKKAGFITNIYKKNISFYHNYFELYYKQNLEYHKLLVDYSGTIIHKIDKLLLSENLFCAYFILNYYNASLDNELISKGIHYIVKNTPTDNFFSEFCKILKILIKENKVISAPAAKLKFFKKLCHKVSENEGISIGNEYYELIINILSEKYTEFFSEPEAFFHLYKRYSDNLNQIYDSKRTLEILEDAEKKLGFFSDIDDKIQSRILSKIYNRKSIPLKDTGKKEQSIDYIEKALQLSLKINDYIQSVSNYHDFGYIYYTNYEETILVKQYWNNAYQLFMKHLKGKTENKKIIISTYQHAIISDILDYSYSHAKEKMQLLETYDHHMPYYENRMHMIKALYCLLTANTTVKNQNIFKQAIKETQDLCVFHNFNRDYYKSFYMLAIYALNNHNYSEAIDNYCLALQTMLFNSKTIKIPQKYYSQIEDIIIQLRMLHSQKEAREILKYTNDIEVKQFVKPYLNMSEEKFKQFYEGYKPHTPITQKNGSWGYPSI